MDGTNMVLRTIASTGQTTALTFFWGSHRVLADGIYLLSRKSPPYATQALPAQASRLPHRLTSFGVPHTDCVSLAG